MHMVHVIILSRIYTSSFRFFDHLSSFYSSLTPFFCFFICSQFSPVIYIMYFEDYYIDVCTPEYFCSIL